MGRRATRRSKLALPHVQRQLARIVASFSENVEGTQLDLLVVLAGKQRNGVGDAVRPE